MTLEPFYMGLLEAFKLACKEALRKEAWCDQELPQIGCVAFSTAGEKTPEAKRCVADT